MKKIFTDIWYVWPRFPGAPFHLTAALLFWTTVAYGFICIFQKHFLH